MTTCIYCLREKEATKFNREHLVPDSFGHYRGALVLRHTVCKSCNDYFGRTLDLQLSRRSAEGLDRYVYGIRDPAKIQKFDFRDIRLVAQLDAPMRGAFAELTFDPELGELVAGPAQQVGFGLRNEEGFKFLLEDDVRGGMTQILT